MLRSYLQSVQLKDTINNSNTLITLQQIIYKIKSVAGKNNKFNLCQKLKHLGIFVNKGINQNIK